MADINRAVKGYLQEKGIQYRNFHTGGVKVKVSDETWKSQRNNSRTPTRVVKMENNTGQQGTGEFAMHKEGKPVLKFDIHDVVSGYPARVKFPGPPGVIKGFFYAKVNDSSQLVDSTGLKLETQVPLTGYASVEADVYSQATSSEAELQCTLTISGRVIVIKDDDTVVQLPVDLLNMRRSFRIRAHLSVNFQDTHTIDVN